MAGINLLRSVGQPILCSGKRMFSVSAAQSSQRRALVPCVINDVGNRTFHSRTSPVSNTPLWAFQMQSNLHTSSSWYGKRWESHNKTVYPPQKQGEARRPAEVHFCRRDIKHSQRKMWYITTFIKGMMIDDALSQLEFVNKKAARIAREVLLEAQEEAVKNHNVEFKSNLHIAEAFVGKGKYQHAIRYHAKGRASMLDLVYCHLFIKLKEGPPPEKPVFTGYDQAKHYIESQKKRTIIHGL